MTSRPSVLLASVLLIACSSSNGGGGAPPAPLVLTAGLATVDPAPTDTISPRVDMQRVDLGGLYPSPSRTYQLTTPAGVPFAFDVLTTAEGNRGWAQVSIAHLLDGTAVPNEGVTSLARAGLVVTGPGVFVDGRTGVWMGVNGSGFARLSVRGQIDRSQVFAIESEVPVPGSVSNEMRQVSALVEISIGALSPINTAAVDGSDHPDVVADSTIYSSDSWYFGMPAVAVSGDRTSLVVYEGDRHDSSSPSRYELRLQHDAATGHVTGGGAHAVGSDSGNWRDHEIAALYNVLAVVQGSGDAVDVRLSFDRGATFAQQQTFDAATPLTTMRLAQIAIAGDYSLAVAWWQSDGVTSQLMLAEGAPSAFDGGGSPTAFTFTTPAVVQDVPYPVVPLPMGMQWSDGGDLVIGHAYSYWEGGELFSGSLTTEFHCASRPWQGAWSDVLVDSAIMIGHDPSVALLGSGDTMQVFYAYERPTGIALVRLVGGQVDQQSLQSVGLRGAYQPAVFAREQNGATRVDLFYIACGPYGYELQASRWQVWGSSAEEHFRLSTASMTPTVVSNPQIDYGYRVHQLAWFGYDAVRDGDDLVLAIDEEQYDAAVICYGAPVFGLSANAATAGGPLLPPTFSNSSPPPLAPGMTLPVPAVNASHRHQLRLVRLH